jgi:hypothetical protein
MFIFIPDSVVGIETRLRDGGVGVTSPADAQEFSAPQNVQSYSGVHSPSYSVDTAGCFTRVKRPELEANNVSLSRT